MGFPIRFMPTTSEGDGVIIFLLHAFASPVSGPPAVFCGKLRVGLTWAPQLKLTGSMSTARVTSAGSVSDWRMTASSRLNALIARVRSMT